MKPVSLKAVVNEMDVIFLESEGIAFVDDFAGQAS
ncbi:MAG: hypothetical protein BMS9Abin06_0426 [Gammaproteobacteria bacterium]|nr:MAG: hypothetical protein BMS9Abin06_0426 [Gammaproteobacteria bacterium]